MTTTRGPLMFRVTNRGRMPDSTPQVRASVTYSFYAHTPYVKVTTITEVRDALNASAIRNGEIVLDSPSDLEGLPKDLPHDVKVDIGALETLESHIVVSDLKLPAGVVAKSDVGETVALITIQKEEVEEVPEAVDLSAIEVEKKGKKDLPAQAGEEGTSA